ncbi:MAG: hypothetical protein P8M25_00110 [Paracoccaceae bacterium]|nr:hypothetical protein [Paracoccaceae bacterium]
MKSKKIAISRSVGNYDGMKYIILILTLIAPSLVGAQSFLCEANQMAGFRLGGNNIPRSFTRETKTTNFILKVDGENYSLTKPNKIFPNHEISSESCGLVTTPSEGFLLGATAIVCSDWLYNFHMDVDTLGFAAAQVSIDWGLGTFSWVGTCAEF